MNWNVFRGLTCRVSILQFLFIGGYISLSAAAPINASTVAITDSSDAWASLVTNLGPLLILVGERHVKAYFKTMSQPSHFILYAVSPIGLVTAIVRLPFYSRASNGSR